MSVSLSPFRNILALAAMSVALTGCAGGGMSLPTFGGGSQAQNSAAASAPQQPGVQSTATEVARTGAITDDTTQLFLANATKLNGYCPQINILGDTNVYQAFEKGGDGIPQQMIHQANITQTARECTSMGEEMYIKIGVAGRVLGGPKSTDKTKVVLPLRVVIKDPTKVLFTKLYKVPVTLVAPDRSGLFAKVEEAIAIPSPRERNVQILVGFDAEEGKRL